MTDWADGKMGFWMTSALVVGTIIGGAIFMLPVSLAPLGANAVPGNPIQHTAFTALGHAYSLGYVVCGIAALVAALLAGFALGGTAHRPLISEESLAE